jgi:hypothetical protein
MKLSLKSALRKRYAVRVGLAGALAGLFAFSACFLDPAYDTIDSADTALITRGEAMRQVGDAYALKAAECGTSFEPALLWSGVFWGLLPDPENRLLGSDEQQNRYVERSAVSLCTKAIVLTPCVGSPAFVEFRGVPYLLADRLCSDAFDTAGLIFARTPDSAN